MNVSEFVGTVSDSVGPDKLKGAIILVAMDRTIDRLIQRAESLDRYHTGTPSAWSHCFLIAGNFSGPNTPILDCTIRDKKNQIIWNETLLDLLKTVLLKSGGIYNGMLADYDDPRVHPTGVKLIPDLSAPDRSAIVDAGLELQRQGFHYDVPGLFRELFLLVTQIPIPAGKKLLFCSAFCQEVYRQALGSGSASPGDFAPGVASPDVLPDDIWYSTKGERFPKDVPTPVLPHGPVRRSLSKSKDRKTQRKSNSPKTRYASRNSQRRSSKK